MSKMIKTYSLELTEFECRTLNSLLGNMTDPEMEKATIDSAAKRQAIHDIYNETSFIRDDEV